MTTRLTTKRIDRKSTQRDRLRNWSRLILAVACIWFFAAVVAPLMQQTPWIHDVHRAADETGIDATGLFYTETEVFSEAELFVREARKTPDDSLQIK